MTDVDRLKGHLARLIATMFARVDYFALYACTIVVQNADGSLEFKPDSDKLPGMSRVPIRLGLPNSTVKVAPGSRVLLGFENGDPARPVASLWDTATCTELVVNGTTIKLNGGNTPVAKEGSVTTGHVHVLSGTAGPFPVIGTALVTTDTIAVRAGSQTVKVP